jgi:hypothetical protein
MEEQTVVSGQLEDSLRNEIESYIEGRLSGVKQEIAQLQSELNESLSRLLDRQAEVQLDGSVAASISEHLRAAHEEGVGLAASESSRAKASSDMAIIKAAIAEVDEQRSQTDVLKTLVNRSAGFAPRVAFFVIKAEQAIGWRARGFQGSIGDDGIRQISFPTNADTVVKEVSNSRTTWSGDPGSQSENQLFVNRLGDEPPQHIVAIPLVVRDRTVAVLYADSARLDSEAINLEALETLVRVSAMAVELLAARSAPAKRVSEPAPAEMHEPTPSYVPSREYDQPAPIAEPEPVADVSASQASYSEPEPAYSEPQSTYSEAQPAFGESQPSMVSSPEPSYDSALRPEPVTPVSSGVEMDAGSSARRRYGMDVDLPVAVASDEERRLHNDARRFARLLVSEIKLYNEQKVVEGRSQHDLYDRLREYIDRSRDMYDKRVKPEVARRYDYFHHELVNTLAEGEVEKLGQTYPGAAVSA